VTICAPANPCCCDIWTTGPGKTRRLVVDWSAYLASQPGLFLDTVLAADLLNVKLSPPAPADPLEIELISGQTPDPANPMPGNTVFQFDNTATMNVVQVGIDTPIGSLYRIDYRIGIRDCNGRQFVETYCVMINVIAC
jgi:hypothetical protein